MSESVSDIDYVQITADIVSAFVSNNAVRSSELPGIIEAVHSSLLKASDSKVEEPISEAKSPAVPVKRSITDDYIICLEDGKKFKSLKRHLSTAYNMSPDEYRAKWGLGRDYPMVAPAYASARSNLARQMGLGRKRDEAVNDGASAAEHPVPDPQEGLPGIEAGDAPRKRGRPRGEKPAA